MADLTKDQVVDYLSNLPVIQIAELIKTLEDKWGVKAAPVAVAAGPAVGGGPAAPAAETAENAGAAGGRMKRAAMKLSPVKKGKTDKPVEVKDDGSVLIDGKPAAKIKGDQVDSTGGTSMLTIGVDGSLVGNGVKAGYKFEGDELVHESGLKLAVADDGTITASKDGKSEPVAKTEGGAASAKRAALVAAVLWLTLPTTVAGDAKAAGKDAKPAKK